MTHPGFGPIEGMAGYGPSADPNYYTAAAPDDVIRQPSHYSRLKIEPKVYNMENGFEFWRGQVVKYVSRAGFKVYPGKDTVESEVMDLEKAIEFCEQRIRYLNGAAI